MSLSDGGPPDDDTPLAPEESLDDDELDLDPEEGYSPVERPRGVSAWGTTADEAATSEDLTHRLAREEPDRPLTDDGDGIGDVSDTDGEPLDDEVGDVRSGRLVLDDPATTDYEARDVGVDGAGASAEEAAVHLVPEDEDET